MPRREHRVELPRVVLGEAAVEEVVDGVAVVGDPKRRGLAGRERLQSVEESVRLAAVSPPGEDGGEPVEARQRGIGGDRGERCYDQDDRRREERGEGMPIAPHGAAAGAAEGAAAGNEI